MAIKLTEGTKNSLRSLIFCELSKPVMNHPYTFLKEEDTNAKHKLVASLVAACAKDKSDEKDPITQEVKNSPTNYDPTLHYDNIPRMNDESFKLAFRIGRSTFQSLLRIIEKRLLYASDSVHPTVPVEKKLLLTLWLLGNNESYSSVLKVFDISKGMAYRIFYQICNELTALSKQYIRWPNQDEVAGIADAFESAFEFPCVVGIIGYCYVDIRPPDDESARERFIPDGGVDCSVILQAVCDDQLLFRDICAWFPGGISPSTVLLESPLYKRLTCKTKPLIELHNHILGSTDYPQLDTLLTPYEEDRVGRPLTEQEQKFNHLHEAAHSLINASFTVLKARFPRLNFIDVCRTELASRVIEAACVVHNFAILRGDDYSQFVDEETVQPSCFQMSASHKRNTIANFL